MIGCGLVLLQKGLKYRSATPMKLINALLAGQKKYLPFTKDSIVQRFRNFQH